MTADPPDEQGQPLTATREFWVLMGYALALGVVGAFAGLIFMGVIGVGDNWYTDSDPGWWGGHWWWVAVTVAGGVVVGLLRHVSGLPDQTPGLIDDLKTGRVEPRMVPGIAVVSAASLIAGASLGPEKALGTIGGGAGTWISARRQLNPDDSEVMALSGFGGAYGGLFSSPVIVVMLLLEVARPGGERFAKAMVGSVVAASLSFGIYFAIAGSVFLDAYQVPQYTFHDWQLLAGIPLGLLATLLVVVLGVFMQVLTKMFARMQVPAIVKPVIGGAVFGLVGVALPLTMFTGSAQLKTVLADGGTLGLGLLGVIVVAKMFTFAISGASGFIGGPIFPALFIGGSAGVFVHELIPGMPLGLTFTCLLAAVPGALMPAPFSMVIMAAFLTQVGALQTAPILIAVITAYLAMEAVKYLQASRVAKRKPSA